MELSDDFYIPTNEFQTEVTKEFLSTLPEEVVEQLLDCIQNIQFVKNLISPDRRRAKDMPRDEKGRIVVDLENPHILEDMDYFRPSALHYKKYNCFTFLRPNPNPNSEYKKWLTEEVRRCREGYVRESDGEWVTGYMYWYMNYCPIMLTKITEGRKKADRVEDFPETWEGIYLRFHYLYKAREAGNHAIELARRGCSKSYTLASMMAKNLILGENTEVRKRVTTILTAYQKEYLSDKDGTLSKFEPMINFVSENTEFPRLRLRSSSNEMFWQMGYLDEYGRKKGSLNNVMGVSSKDDEDKLRGKRGYIFFEEMGAFPNLLGIYDTVRHGMEEGDYTYGLAYLVGTSAEKESNFESAKTLLYNTSGYNIYSIKNVYDKPRQGKPTFGYFFPAYLNRKGCYNKDGVSDVIKALVQVLMARYKAKYSSDPNSVLRVIAEMPITPAEAIIKVKNAFFPVTALTERLQQLDLDPRAFDDIYVGELVLEGTEVKFVPTDATPIRKWGVDNSTRGAVEIYEMPQKNSSGKVYENRYILGHDPVDNDEAESTSLSSTFVMDLYTDRIVAEYTGRMPFADDNFEIVRMLCLFYNGRCLYESNKKGIFAYFQKMQCTHLLADTPEYLRDKQMIKYSSFGSNAHPYTEKVYTPDGLKLWEEIQVGDILFAPDGTTTKVVNIPIDEELDIYEMTLRDGRKVRASGEHLWSVYKGAKANKTPVLRTTVQLKEDLLYHREGRPSEPKYYIHKNCGVEYEEQFIPMNPYLLGLMLGDGCMSSKFKTSGKYLEFTSSIEDMKEYMEYLKLPYKTLDDRHHKIELAGWSDVVNYLKLANTNSHTKFIPDCYKYNSREVRLEILKGLFDTDGTIAREGGTPYYTTTSKQLASDVLEIARSLGINGNMTESSNSYGSIYNVRLYTTTIVFKLKRKANKQRQVRCRDIFTSIIDIKYIGRERAKCVTVDREDGLYLIGDYITTHNCKGVNATAAINNFANGLIRDWLLKPVPTIVTEDGEEREVQVSNLYFLRGRALLEELIAFDPVRNFDRIRALGMLMLYREEKIILYGPNLNAESYEKADRSYLGNDDYFSRNYNYE